MWLFRVNLPDADMNAAASMSAGRLRMDKDIELTTYASLRWSNNPADIVYKVEPFIYKDALHLIGYNATEDIYAVWRVNTTHVTRIISTAARSNFGKVVSAEPIVSEHINVFIDQKREVVHDSAGNIYIEGWFYNIVHVNIETLTIRLIPMTLPGVTRKGKPLYKVYKEMLHIVNFSSKPFDVGTRTIVDGIVYIELSAFSHLPKDIYPYDIAITNDILYAYCAGCERAQFSLSDLSYIGRDEIDPCVAKRAIHCTGDMHVYHVTNRKIREDLYRRDNRIMFENVVNSEKYEYTLPINDPHWRLLS